MSRTSCCSSQAVSKPVWHIPLLCVQWKPADDGQRNCPKHVEFLSKNKSEKLVHLVGFILRIYHDARSPELQIHLYVQYTEQTRALSEYRKEMCLMWIANYLFNPLTPNDPYSGRNAPLTSKRCILYIYSTNICTEYFKHGIYSPFFFSSKFSLFHTSNVFGSCIIHFYIQGVLKLKK